MMSTLPSAFNSITGEGERAIAKPLDAHAAMHAKQHGRCLRCLHESTKPIGALVAARNRSMNETNSTAVRVLASYHDVPIMALTVTFAQIVFRLTVVSVGLLLNGVVFLVVSCSRQLRYPRHIFWAAVALVDCLFLAQCVLELAVIVNHDRLACAFNVLLAFTDYSILLLFLCLAALDRYVAIVRYERYKRSVTNRATVTLLSCASGVTFVVITSPFWTGHRSVHTCTINLAQMYWVFTWNSLLATFCVFLHVVIFVKSKTIIRAYFPNHRQPPIRLKFVNSSARLPGQHSGKV
ncbi:5-hydroxytryptamine receptor 1D-like [Daphnia carinata]|uniref:5-hydroxytryptamine receptor 1D-like n=1 Tax=Daphnia carinata TaxID=120202 RepID=UPI0028685A27|nr:5-hydroxytryptamine receptor 1D-like [Daphnia carinata]XP_059352412.1 5-hydroxytryptamine receptor 1D-like [Daphnia carinata]